MAASLTSSVISASPSPAQLLDQKFGRKGIKFTESGSVELTVRNGSSAQLRLSDGLVTSYKPKVFWKEDEDAFEEMVYTISDDDGVVNKGGIGLVLNDNSRKNPDGSAWSARNWTLKDVNFDSIDALQVELSCSDIGDGSLDITYVVSLFSLSIATAVIVKNNGSSDAELTSGILSHLKFKGRGGSAITGLIGCSYCSHPPLPSSFGILSPDEAMLTDPPGWFDNGKSSATSDNGIKQGTWKVEDDTFVMMRKRMSRVYAAPPAERLKRVYRTPPSKYETIDQGKGIGFRLIRMGGYEDIYLSSPGSSFKTYGEDYFICTGPASMLVPVLVKPGQEWRGAQVLEHDNL